MPAKSAILRGKFMSILKACCLAACLLAVGTSSWAQEKKKTEERRTVTEVLDHTILNLEEEFVPAAEAMPDDKYDFAPTNGEFKGVRTFAQQVKHVAAVNYELGAAILQQKPPGDLNGEAGPASITSKADILKYLKDSFAYVHKAVRTIDEKNEVETVKSPFGEGRVSRLGLACGISWHGYDHYGQMVEYLRMNGIIPPASR
jgi:DinB superfamily